MDHFGSPFVEQRQLVDGQAIVELSDNEVVTITGPDRLTWLDSMTSQRIATLSPGESAETLLLDPNGHIEHAIRLVDDGETTWMLVNEGEAESLMEFLNRMRFALRVDVTRVTDQVCTFGFFSGGAVSELIGGLRDAAHTMVLWEDPWRTGVSGGWQYAVQTPHPGESWSYSECVVDTQTAQRIREAVFTGTIVPAGMMAREALRIAAWRPNLITEVDDRALPHEFDWLRSAVHLNKGCYRGQETVAKVHNLGHPPRRLAMLHLDGSDAVLPARGDLVFVPNEEKPVGRITSVGRHMEWGAIALALLKRSVPEDAALEVHSDDHVIPATQEVIVPQSAGATRQVPRMPRRPI